MNETNAPKTVKARKFDCPSCGSSVTQKLPGKSVAVYCQKCKSLIDTSHEVMKIIDKYQNDPTVSPLIELGTHIQMENQEWEFTGYVERADQTGGSWQEYVFFNPYLGYRYLVRSADHYIWISPVPDYMFSSHDSPISSEDEYTPMVKFRGKQVFKRLTSYKAYVKFVMGELPWLARKNEENYVMEYINPPYVASVEGVQAKSKDEQKRTNDRFIEANWSLGEYKTPEEIQQAFQLKEPLHKPTTIGACEPNRYKGKWKNALLTAILSSFFLTGLCVAVPEENKEIMNSIQRIPISSMDLKKEGATDYLEFQFEAGTIELDKPKNLTISLKGIIDNQWVSINYFLMNENTREGFVFPSEISYYHGVDGGESWSEGSTSAVLRTQVLPAGTYYIIGVGATSYGLTDFKKHKAVLDVLKKGTVKPETLTPSLPSGNLDLTVTIHRDVTSQWPAVLAFFIIWSMSFYYFVRKRAFETARHGWYAMSYQSAGEDEEDEDDE